MFMYLIICQWTPQRRTNTTPSLELWDVGVVVPPSLLKEREGSQRSGSGNTATLTLLGQCHLFHAHFCPECVNIDKAERQSYPLWMWHSESLMICFCGVTFLQHSTPLRLHLDKSGWSHRRESDGNGPVWRGTHTSGQWWQRCQRFSVTTLPLWSVICLKDLFRSE